MFFIVDNQIPGRLFADGAVFKTKSEIVEQLTDFHDIDFTGTDDKDNELSIEEYFKFWKINTVKDQLKFLLEHGDWSIEKLSKREVRKFKIEEATTIGG